MPIALDYFLLSRHNDLAWALYREVNNQLNAVNLNENLTGLGWSICHTDIPRLRQGLLGAQVYILQYGAIALQCFTYLLRHLFPSSGLLGSIAQSSTRMQSDSASTKLMSSADSSTNIPKLSN